MIVGIPFVRAIALVKLRLEVLEPIGLRGMGLYRYEFALRKINGVVQADAGYSTLNKPVVLTKCVRIGITRMIPLSVPYEKFRLLHAGNLPLLQVVVVELIAGPEQPSGYEI